ncbi:Chondroadherin-like protein like [Argiope bruennichi]|uniref:Chondroadherin-like protein like n=1 Tax=Argiope bruennichi TaxID=94029 RepID=A0A8T0G1H4_ARGBR|nr:Chondroadherin-like protein like [Argiope bruennichi]
MMLFAFALVLLQAVAIQGSFVNLCPSFEDLAPCNCVSDGKTIRVDCIQVNDIEEARKAVHSTEGIKRVFIDFLRSSLDKVPSDLFKGLHVTKLSFTNCKLKTFGDEGRSALEGLEDIIEEFSIHFSFMGENDLKFLNVSSLRVLEDLEIEGNDIHELNNEWFRNGPVSVKNLFIMTNFIEKLGDRAFASLKNLRNLWLTGNKFKTLKRTMFPYPATHLTSLDLTNNDISAIPEDLFIGMPSLKEVILAENHIKRVPESTWSLIWGQVTRVYLESNPLECDSHIEWMFKVARPYVLKGKCVSPAERKDVDLKRIIDDKQRDEDYDDF